MLDLLMQIYNHFIVDQMGFIFAIHQSGANMVDNYAVNQYLMGKMEEHK